MALERKGSHELKNLLAQSRADRRAWRSVRCFAQSIHKEYKQRIPPFWRKPLWWLLGIVSALVLLLVQLIRPASPLQVFFYDVGQGDAIHIRTASGFDVLIDGGPTAQVLEKLGRTLPFWDHTIELLVLTHPHADHVVGLISVLKRFKVEQVLTTGVLHTTDEYAAWLEEIKKQRIPMEVAKAGQGYGLGEGRGETRPGGVDSEGTQGSSSAPLQFWDARGKIEAEAADAPNPSPPHRRDASFGGNSKAVLEILHPVDDFSGKRVQEGKLGEGGGLNDTSIVARLTYGQTSFLLMGDATSAVEKVLTKCVIASEPQGERGDPRPEDCRGLRPRNDNLKADVLKVGHHGSKYSTSREFLEAVQPRYAVIQVGKNHYGHPAYAPLYRLKQAGVEVLRNDQEGDVVFESDGLDLIRIP